MKNQRIPVALLTMSLAGFATWQASEHFVASPMVPTQDDRPTIGYGSTKYEDGRPVKMSDPPITRQRAAVLARNLMTQDEKVFAASLPGVALHQEEFDVFMDFTGQFGTGNWQRSSMRKRLLAGDHAGACDALLAYRFAAGYDCSTLIDGQRNRRCWGVWERQQKRHAACMAVQ